MPAIVKRVKAQKDYPQFGISRGQIHYTWSIPRGGTFQKFRSVIKPKESQLYAPGYQQDFAVLKETAAALGTIDDAEQIQSLIDDITALKEDTEEKLSNMPEQLQDSDTGQLMSDRIAELDSWIDELTDIHGDAEQLEDGDEEAWADVSERVHSCTP